jgi:predicted peroxiredoxin
VARRVVSILRSSPASPRPSDAALEANAFAVAEDVDLSLVLRSAGVELAQRRSALPVEQLAGTTLPDPAGGQDLRALLESGVPVYVGDACVAELGLDSGDLLEGVRIVDADALAALLRDADAVLTW